MTINHGKKLKWSGKLKMRKCAVTYLKQVMSVLLLLMVLRKNVTVCYIHKVRKAVIKFWYPRHYDELWTALQTMIKWGRWLVWTFGSGWHMYVSIVLPVIFSLLGKRLQRLRHSNMASVGFIWVIGLCKLHFCNNQEVCRLGVFFIIGKLGELQSPSSFHHHHHRHHLCLHYCHHLHFTSGFLFTGLYVKLFLSTIFCCVHFGQFPCYLGLCLCPFSSILSAFWVIFVLLLL